MHKRERRLLNALRTFNFLLFYNLRILHNRDVITLVITRRVLTTVHRIQMRNARQSIFFFFFIAHHRIFLTNTPIKIVTMVSSKLCDAERLRSSDERTKICISLVFALSFLVTPCSAIVLEVRIKTRLHHTISLKRVNVPSSHLS